MPSALAKSADLPRGIEHTLTARILRKADGTVEVRELTLVQSEEREPDLSQAVRYFQMPS